MSYITPWRGVDGIMTVVEEGGVVVMVCVCQSAGQKICQYQVFLFIILVLIKRDVCL